MTDPTPPSSPGLGDAARLLAEAAQIEAQSLGHPFVGLEHVLLALLADSSLATLGKGRGLPAREELRRRLSTSPAPRPIAGTGEYGLSPQARRALEGSAPFDRTALLERIMANPRGPLARLLETGGQADRRAGGQPASGQAGAPPADRRPRGPAGERDKGRKPRETRPVTERLRESRNTAEGQRREQPRKVARPSGGPTARPWWLSWRSLMLLFVPATIGLNLMHANPLVVFIAACLGVIPLAGVMGEATEHLAARSGPAIGGLLNATFGNAAELIIAIAALRSGLIDLVKASITGSILGNLLLIMGLCFLAGGIGRPTLRFNRVSAGASAGMMALAVVGLVFPALFHSIRPEAGFPRELMLTESVALVLAVTYGFSLLFSLKTHRSLFGGEPHPTVGEIWSPIKATVVLGLATLGVVVQSEILVHATENVTATMGFSETFLGLIIVPIIGNAAEHGTAVLVARKGQMDLAMQIALGSSTQVALLVAPVLVLVGLLLGRPMDLVFTTFEVAALALTMVVSAIITLDGESNWFEGVQLLAMYALVAAMAFFV
ncbi:MAG TPA: calcium/proton exchanger [Gemmatimonadales bacterium]